MHDRHITADMETDRYTERGLGMWVVMCARTACLVPGNGALCLVLNIQLLLLHIRV